MALPAFCTEAQVEAATGLAIGTASTDQVTTAQFTQALANATNEITSAIPERYRNLLTKVDGEILEKYADGGETVYTLSLSTATAASIKLYKNYGPSELSSLYARLGLTVDPTSTNVAYSKSWKDRNAADTLTVTDDYSVDGQTITMVDEMTEGDTLYADYDHVLATVPAIIQTVAGLLTAGYCYITAFNLDDPSDTEYMQNFFTNGRQILQEIRDGKRSIPEFDDIDLVLDWSAPGERMGLMTAEIRRA